MDNQKHVGIWIRVSTEDQVKGESPEHHEKRARAYAESRGWVVKEVYRLDAVSGKSVIDHPLTQRMLSHIQSGHITGLIFSKLARLARNTKELLEFAELFNESHADLVSLQESIDTSTPAGRLFYTMIAAMAQWEREEIAERVAASVPIRAKLGKPLGGAAPFGYEWIDKKLVINPKEAPVRRLIYELFLEHKRKKTVANLLNKAGYRTRGGSKFGYSTVYRLLKDTTAKGLHRANYSKRAGNHNEKFILKPQSDWIYTEAPAIVSSEVWEECNRILDDQLKKNKRPTKKVTHLFTGVSFCHCGGKMYVPSNSPKYVCMVCRNKLLEKDMEDIFREQLKAFLFSDHEISNYFASADDSIKTKADLLSTLSKEKEETKKQMDDLVELYLHHEIPKDGFGLRYQPFDQRLKQIEAQIPDLQAEIDYLKIHRLSSHEVLEEAKDLYTRWPDLTYEEKRAIVELITERITIGKEDIEISLAYLPSLGKSMADGHQSMMDLKM